MGQKLLEFAKEYFAGKLTAEEFADPYQKQWKVESGKGFWTIGQSIPMLLMKNCQLYFVLLTSSIPILIGIIHNMIRKN